MASLLPRSLRLSTRRLLSFFVILAFGYFTLDRLRAHGLVPLGEFSDTWARHPPPSLHRFRDDGLVEVDMDGRHPILDLIARGEKRWHDMLSRQSCTLSEAVEEYRRRYLRDPPLGFDKWWNFASKNGVKLVDEFDHINDIVEPYFSLPPGLFQQRVEELENMDFSWHLAISRGRLKATGMDTDRREDIIDLIWDFVPHLPDLVFHASDHDRGNIILGSDHRAEAIRLARLGKYMSRRNLTHFEEVRRYDTPLKHACSRGSRAMGNGIDASNQTGFIHDHIKTMNFCDHPLLLEYHGALANGLYKDSRLKPMFVHCKFLQDSSFLMPALIGYGNVRPNQDTVLPWSQRKETKLFWRGRSTGTDFDAKGDWRLTHRPNLHLVTNAKHGHVDLLLEDANGKLERRKYDRASLNEWYMNVGLVRPILQCLDRSPQPEFCESVEKEMQLREPVSMQQGSEGKFVIDVDGNGWSQRFARLLASGSVVLKSTVFPEWNTPWLVPYVHYIPVQGDYSDLYDIMAFFSGGPGGISQGHDDLAEKIANNSMQFVREHWRWEDMQAYMFRLLLEYARLYGPDRERMSYSPS